MTSTGNFSFVFQIDIKNFHIAIDKILFIYFFSDQEVTEHLLIVDEYDDNNNKEEGSGGVKFRIRDLRKESETTGDLILKGVNVDIPKGMIVGIIGPSGSGKSTLLRALNRLWEPSSGSVFLDGRDICDLDVLALRRRVGMLFQLPVLFEGTSLR